ARAFTRIEFTASGYRGEHFSGCVAAQGQLDALRQAGDVKLEHEVFAKRADFGCGPGTAIESSADVHAVPEVQVDGQHAAAEIRRIFDRLNRYWLQECRKVVTPGRWRCRRADASDCRHLQWRIHDATVKEVDVPFGMSRIARIVR